MLPLNEYLTFDEVDYICKVIKSMRRNKLDSKEIAKSIRINLLKMVNKGKSSHMDLYCLLLIFYLFYIVMS